MTAAEWRNEAEEVQKSLDVYGAIGEKLIHNAAKCQPVVILKGRMDAEELYDIILDGIKRSARERDSLQYELKKSRIALKIKTKEVVDIEKFAESAMQYFSKLHMKYEVSDLMLPLFDGRSLPVSSALTFPLRVFQSSRWKNAVDSF